jgi:hypothetical protein
MNVEVSIIDMKMKIITLHVEKSVTIGKLRKLFKKKGGDGINNQWKYDGRILDNDDIKLENIQGFDPEEMAITVTTNVRGGI